MPAIEATANGYTASLDIPTTAQANNASRFNLMLTIAGAPWWVASPTISSAVISRMALSADASRNAWEVSQF